MVKMMMKKQRIIIIKIINFKRKSLFILYTKVEIVGHRNSPNIEYELTTKRPCSSLLKNQPLQKKKTKVNEPNTTVW
ncbi:unnamed protein product [Rotaria socialis]|uniref:Uncharacterized protein n=2 Tax=Rotaria socialis TaxID=392032 RepID=A0A818B8I2_9BILA|nr:unnamed protein product [Rotaria socialis]CAF3384031.1 unnamed protein product [Rotaria socialis]CAF3413371.1 unnamed protein product [Rotaria socialis]